MPGSLPPLSVWLFPPESMVAYWADAYCEAARADMPMRQAVESLELLRESVLGGDALEALHEADDQLGAAFGMPLERIIATLRAAMEDALIKAIGFPEERRRRELFGLLLARSRVRLLRRILDGWAASPQPGDAAINDLLRKVQLEAWPLVHDPMRELAATLPEGPVRARLEFLTGQIQLFHFGRFGAAWEIFERARSNSPDDLEVVGTMGRWWDMRGDVDKARELYNKEISLGPDRPGGYARLARSLAWTGEFVSAEAQLNQALAVAPGDTDAMYGLIGLYSRRELYPSRGGSIAEIEKKLLRMAPDEEAGLRITIAAQHRDAGRLDLAISAYKNATVLSPDRTDAWIGRGACAMDRARAMDVQLPDRQRQLQEAHAFFVRALEAEPQTYWAHEGLSVVAELEGDLAKALTHARDGGTCHPDWAVSALVRQGKLHRSAKELPDADRVLRQALKLDPGNREALSELVLVGDEYLYENSNREDAISVYEIVRLGFAGTSSAVADNRMGNLYFYERNFEAAAECYRKALQAQPVDSVLHGNLADALIKNPAGERKGERLEEAIAALQRAIELDPASTRYATLLREAQAEQDLLARYGAEALTWLPTYPPISVSVEATLMPEIADESRTKLNEQADAATNALREAIWQRTGLTLPAVTFREFEVGSVLPGAWEVVIDGVNPVNSGFLTGTGKAAGREFFAALEAALLAGIPAWLSLDVVSASLVRAGLGNLAGQPRRLLELREAICEAARAGPPRADLLSELAGQEAAGADAHADQTAEATDAIPELAQAPDLHVGKGFDAATLKAAVEAARRRLFEETGVVLPRVKVSTEASIPFFSWRLISAALSDAREVEPIKSSGLLNEELADTLRPALPAMFSRQLLDHYFVGIAAQRPALVAAARTALGNARIATSLLRILRQGQSLRNLPLVLEELVRDVLVGTISRSAAAVPQGSAVIASSFSVATSPPSLPPEGGD